MANVKDAETVIAATVVVVELTRNFDTKELDGDAKVTLVTSEAGFAVVKIKQRDLVQLKPVAGQRVAWVVRSGHWARGEGSGMSCGFVRLVAPGDLDLLQSLVAAPSKSAA